MTLRFVRATRPLAAAAALALAAPAALLAQYPTGALHGRLQTEFRTSDIRTQNPDGTPAALNLVVGNEIFVRRAYLEFTAQLASNITGKLEVNATRRAVNLEDAYVDVGLGRFVTWRVGQEKKPIERQELNSSNSYLTVERGAQVNGLRNPNLVSQNNFLTAVGFTSHDVGTSLEFHNPAESHVPVSLRLGVWNGAGKDLNEVNNAKTFGARLVVSPIKGRLSLGAAFVSHDDPITVGGKLAVDSAGRSTGFGVDGEWGTIDRGLHIMADAAFGRESRVGALTPSIAGLRATPPVATSFEPRFTSFHVVGEYKYLLPENGIAWAVGPVFRIDRTNPDTDNTGISSTMLTPGLNVYFSPRTWLMFNYDVIQPGDALDIGRGAGETVHSFKTMMRIWF